jgi:hypothetical protein
VHSGRQAAIDRRGPHDMTMIECCIDFNVDDRVNSIKQLLKHLSPIADSNDPNERIINLKRCQYLGPDAVALLGAVILDSREQGAKLQIVPPDSPSELRNFFRLSGLETLAKGVQFDEELWLGQTRPVLPLRQVRSASFHDADPIIHMLQQYGRFKEEFEEYLRICVNEVIQNIKDHANSRIGGLMTARFMEKTREVRVAIVDRGVGICTTLSRRWPDTNAQNVMPRVLEGSYSARSRKNNLGLGISNLAAIIKQLGGVLFILSERSAAEVLRDGGRRFSGLPVAFQGTGVFFTLSVGD